MGVRRTLIAQPSVGRPRYPILRSNARAVNRSSGRSQIQHRRLPAAISIPDVFARLRDALSRRRRSYLISTRRPDPPATMPDPWMKMVPKSQGHCRGSDRWRKRREEDKARVGDDTKASVPAWCSPEPDLSCWNHERCSLCGRSFARPAVARSRQRARTTFRGALVWHR